MTDVATPTITGRSSGKIREANQCHGMPRAICHACGLGYKCWDQDCEQTGQAPSILNGPQA